MSDQTTDRDDITDDDDAPSAYDRWRDENADALEANDNLTAEREEAAEDKEEIASLLYDPPAEPEPEPTPEELRAAADEEVQQALDWNEADKEVLGQIGVRMQAFNADAQVYMDAFQQAERMKAEGQAVPFEVQQKLRDEAERLAAEKQSLLDAGQKVRQAAELKTAEGARRRMFRDIPALKIDKTRKEFIEWAVDQGFSRESVIGAQDPNVIGPAFKRFDAERKAAAAERREKERVANLPHRTRIHEIRGEFDLGTMMYGSVSEKKSHRRAVEKNR